MPSIVDRKTEVLRSRYVCLPWVARLAAPTTQQMSSGVVLPFGQRPNAIFALPARLRIFHDQQGNRSPHAGSWRVVSYLAIKSLAERQTWIGSERQS